VVVTPNVIKVSPNPATVGLNQTVTLTAAGAVPDNGRVGYEWTLVTNNSHSPESVGTLGNTFRKLYRAGTTAGTDTIRVSDTWGNVGEVQVVVTPSAVSAPTSVPLQCKAPVPPAKISAPVALTQDITVRDTIGKNQTCVYSAPVSSGQTYVLSVTGIIGEARLNVFKDATLKEPVSCVSPNLYNNFRANSRTPADCTFVATTATVYASVSTSPTAALANSYNVRYSPHFEAAAASYGTQENPITIPNNKPYGASVGSAATSSYYKVNTTGSSGDVVISMTGLTGFEDISLRIYQNPNFTGMQSNASCWTGEPYTFPESCILPAGKTYYLYVFKAAEHGGPFTLMVDAPGATAAPAPAAPRAPAAAISTSATP
jgi:hypothetical protein